MRDLILTAAIVVAACGVLDALRWHQRLARARAELAAVVDVALAAGVKRDLLVALVTRRTASRGRVPFEVLRILRGAGR